METIDKDELLECLQKSKLANQFDDQVIKRLFELDYCRFPEDNELRPDEDPNDYLYYLDLTGPEAIKVPYFQNQIYEMNCKGVNNYQEAINKINNFTKYECDEADWWDNQNKQSFTASILELDYPDSDDESECRE